MDGFIVIVDPDFLDHWKTKMLVNLLADELAPLYVMRLWAHCQNRRQTIFVLHPEALKALCRFPGQANKLESSLLASGFIRRIDTEVEICNWDEYNSSLIASWVNGKLGGRPKKNKVDKNPTETRGLPTGNPPATQAKPIREERSREEKKSLSPPLRDDVKIPDELSIPWARWCGYIMESQGKSIGAIEAESMLKSLLDRGIEKAIRDIEFSIRKRCKTIRDSDNDYDKKPAGTRGGKREVAW